MLYNVCMDTFAIAMTNELFNYCLGVKFDLIYEYVDL